VYLRGEECGFAERTSRRPATETLSVNVQEPPLRVSLAYSTLLISALQMPLQKNQSLKQFFWMEICCIE
jgi:hypothetical protein